MPLGSAKDKRDVAIIANFLVGLMLLFGSVPVLNIGVSSPLFGGITFGTLFGLVLVYTAYVLWKARGF